MAHHIELDEEDPGLDDDDDDKMRIHFSALPDAVTGLAGLDVQVCDV